MTGWPPWRRAQPAQLPRYVHTGVLTRVLRQQPRLPGRSGAPSWNASQTFLAGHPALRGLKAVAALEKWSGDKVARQHLAILRLTEHVPAGDVFDAILDPTDARQLLLRVARTGSAALATTRDDRAEQLHRIAAAITPTGERSD